MIKRYLTQKTKRRSTPAPFVCLPKSVLAYPPVAHRGASADGLLSVFDIAVATGIVASGYRGWTLTRDSEAMKAGRQAVADRDALGGAVAAAKRNGVNYCFKGAMRDAYWQSYSESRAPKVVTYAVSKSALLKAAHLSRGGKNYRSLDGALNRLRRPVWVGDRDWPPLLVAIERLRGNRLKLSVSGQWLPPVFGRVPVPVPTHGNCANALALFLFLCGTDQRPGSRTASIKTETLCRRIGIVFRWPAEACVALRNALETVNTHLAQLNRDSALVAAGLPTQFELCPLNDGDRLSFKALYGTDTEQTTATNPELMDDDDLQPEETEAERRSIELYDRERRERREWAAFQARLEGNMKTRSVTWF